MRLRALRPRAVCAHARPAGSVQSAAPSGQPSLTKPLAEPMPPVYLSKSDWEEVYYALDSKSYAGAYIGAGWRKHLLAIMQLIGPDGSLAAERGTRALG